MHPLLWNLYKFQNPLFACHHSVNIKQLKRHALYFISYTGSEAGKRMSFLALRVRIFPQAGSQKICWILSFCGPKKKRGKSPLPWNQNRYLTQSHSFRFTCWKSAVLSSNTKYSLYFVLQLYLFLTSWIIHVYRERERASLRGNVPLRKLWMNLSLVALT